MISRKISVSFLIFLLTLFGCTVNYSFTGVSTTAETISISNFYNDADNGPPDLAQVFTDQMREYYQRNTNLQFVEGEADLLIEGSVTGFKVTPAAATGGSSRTDLPTATQNRLTIIVKVSFTNIAQPEQDFNKNFQAFVDYDASQNIADVEQDLIKEIYDQIILNIFNETVANW